MKNLKLIVATCASVAALGVASTGYAQDSMTSTPAASHRSTSTPSRHGSRATPNSNGCNGPASFCNTYFGN